MARCGVVVCLLLKSGHKEAWKLRKFERGPGTMNGRGAASIAQSDSPAARQARRTLLDSAVAHGPSGLRVPNCKPPVIVAQRTPTLASPPTCNANGEQPSLNLETRSQPHSIATSFPTHHRAPLQSERQRVRTIKQLSVVPSARPNSCLQRADNHDHGCRSCRRRHKPTWLPGSPRPPFSLSTASWALPSARQCGSLYVGALDTRQLRQL